ncbi:hypothetical protein A2U01_0028290 [Trifolium medium]|uniref:Uncharacterized protein n=1 Tax=Trifolium medium TaxID=97028 RepID=A0A392P8I5_9FABA|nr:hypothetical protein [Trifolium medium]
MKQHYLLEVARCAGHVARRAVESGNTKKFALEVACRAG